MITALKAGDPAPRIERTSVATEHLMISEGSAEEAVNLGLMRSRGEVFCFVASEDLLMRIDWAVSFFSDPKVDVVYGDCMIVSKGRNWIYRNPVGAKMREHLKYSCCVTNGFFYRRRVFEKIGGFDPSMGSAADYDFLVRAVKEEISFKKIGGVFYVWNQRPDSRSVVGKKDADRVKAKHPDFVKPKLTTFGGLKYSALWHLGL